MEAGPDPRADKTKYLDMPPIRTGSTFCVLERT